MAFGTQVTCFIPPDLRAGSKTPGQKKYYAGIVIGYTENMQAYNVWHIEKRQKKEVSFFHCVIHEGFYPFRNKKNWKESDNELPHTFSPRLEDMLVEEEFKKYGFSEEEEKEILSMYFPKTDEKEEGEEDYKHVDKPLSIKPVPPPLPPRPSTPPPPLTHSEKIEKEAKEKFFIPLKGGRVV